MSNPFPSQPVNWCYTMPTQVVFTKVLRVICSSLVTSILAWTGAQLAAQALAHMLKQVLHVLIAAHIKLSVLFQAQCHLE
ncbi:hypothetical protein TRIATDRAFT_300688 [Trichoderma atroviride IMI 206040]|uniref:Uncharacterized protein n=1 Tax=Hypocrea atroviridis (strain ATCC 20476 / IMI 206040) TaxID=452589 RepID=G9NYT3_HYPAI|nr:uncharacterized protein TRIATDRAFT_300688 [Trichoderma atroviride IMI 206040]EHK44539.1 hypothetical protein TRIATDRAFT_300688 [Trichoderma atroviride IMI 206040]